MKRCAGPHPEMEAQCILPEGRHASHTDGTNWWPDPEVVAELAKRPSKVKERRGRAKSNVSKEGRNTMLSARARMADPNAQTDDPMEWREQVLVAMSEFLEGHDGEFTTPEHIWPLIPDPNVDRRNMQQVIQEALRRGMIVKTGQTRWLGDTYSTSDGHTFQINKWTPVYRKAK